MLKYVKQLIKHDSLRLFYCKYIYGMKRDEQKQSEKRKKNTNLQTITKFRKTAEKIFLN